MVTKALRQDGAYLAFEPYSPNLYVAEQALALLLFSVSFDLLNCSYNTAVLAKGQGIFRMFYLLKTAHFMLYPFPS
ncbi:hypothetical protein [Lederbergia ruris]|uniref:hypothetical protein n=1 Tax=Lederbergia ruris TaxID=217495 RepID=UPI001BB3EA81|nr:hypothetical protein [Lederbergia ruris]